MGDLEWFRIQASRIRFGLKTPVKVNVYKWSAMRKVRKMTWQQVWYWVNDGYPEPPSWMYPKFHTRGACL